MNLFVNVFLISLVFGGSLNASPLNLTSVISIKTGQVQGKIVNFRGNDVYHFLGIPFAEPPTGQLRFKRSVEAKPWNGVLSATEYGPACYQANFGGLGPQENMSEDCLSLNIFAPSRAVEDRNSDSQRRPVMVWIYGGAFNLGSSNTLGFYDGTALALLQDVIVVSFNYRVSALGFLHLPEHGIEGNMGLWDQNLALKWVQANIDQFGGDPERVTIFGESAGSWSVGLHIVSPASRGLFKNAIMQSGSPFDIDRWLDLNTNMRFVSHVGCKGSSDVLTCLQSYDIEKFTDADSFTFFPVVGDEFISARPEDLVSKGALDSSVNILLGATEKEGLGMLFLIDPLTFHPENPANLTMSDARRILGQLLGKNSVDMYLRVYFKGLDESSSSDEIRQRVVDAYGDVVMFCPTYMFGHDAVLHSPEAATGSVYAYHLAQKPSKGWMEIVDLKSNWKAATHADDLSLVFGRPILQPDSFSREDLILSLIMMDTWGSFAREGKPPKQGPHEWKPWSKDGNGNVKMAAMDFHTNAIGRLETEHLEICQKNWPFPLETRNAELLLMNPGVLMKTDHDEL